MRELFCRYGLNAGFCLALAVIAQPLFAQINFDLSLGEVGVNNNITYQTGDPIEIEAEVDNLGSAASTAFTVNFYISTDSTITGGDILLGSANRAALVAGNSDNFFVNLNIPLGLNTGNYFIGAIIDVDDANNGNNRNLEDEAVMVVSSGFVFVINSGLNDAWFNVQTQGQGFFISVFSDISSIFLAWFTYDTERPDSSVSANLGEPGHRWLTAFGGYSANIASLDVELTRGGVFDSGEPAVEQGSYGTIQIEFMDCNNAVLRYNMPSPGLSGEIPITRIAPDNINRCLVAQPQ